MVLLVESGSTKADWLIINGDSIHRSFQTEGLNPFSNKASYDIIKQTSRELPESEYLDEIHFYGAGVVGLDVTQKIGQSFDQYEKAKIEVNDDLLGAARATIGNKPGTVCILGTGSNIGYYDGAKIITKVASGGYLLGGEGSGMALGRQVLVMYLRHQLCDNSARLIEEKYQINHSNITHKVYNQAVPNRYMASFAPIVNQLSPQEKSSITDKVFTAFLNERILKLKAPQISPIHFVGSIANSFKNEIEHILKINNLVLGKVVEKPIHNLVKYHIGTK